MVAPERLETLEPTLDQDIMIEARGTRGTAPWVRYRRASTGATWVVWGTCNQCGLCAIGVVGDWHEWVGPPGTPGANRDRRVAAGRLDDPVTPGFFAAAERQARVTPTATVTGCSMWLGLETT